MAWLGNRRFSVVATGSDSPRGPAFGPDGYLYSKVLPPAVAIGLLRGSMRTERGRWIARIDELMGS